MKSEQLEQLAKIRSEIDDIIWIRNDLEHKSRLAKPTFTKFIADTSIPLETRWQLWLKVDVSLKETGVYDDFFKDIYQTIEMESVVNELLEQGRTDDADAIKEQVLQKNIHSFITDW